MGRPQLLRSASFIMFFSILAGWTDSVEVHFENKDGGFFLKHTRSNDDHQQSSSSPSPSSEVSSPASVPIPSSSILSVDRFTVLQTAQPVAVRATYGPFSTKQTVPARYIVPDPLESESNSYPTSTITTVNATIPLSAVLDVDLYAHNLDISAHLVTPEVQRDSPVLRVLFHTGRSLGVYRPEPVVTSGSGLGSDKPLVCIVLHATLESSSMPADLIGGIASACTPEGRDGICLAEATLPASWWPSVLPPETKKPVKPPKSLVNVAYSVFEPWDDECVATPMARVQIQPITPLASVPLTHGKHGYREVRSDEMVHMLVPQGPLYPNSRVYIPVFLEEQTHYPISFFIIRARVKSGLKILGVERGSNLWNVTYEINPKQSNAVVTALKRERSDPATSKAVVEIFSWYLSVEEPSDFWEGGKIVWTLRYVLESTAAAVASAAAHARSNGGSNIGGFQLGDLEEERRKMTTRLDIQKDDVQAVLPISKNWELINTAVLTGRQVSQPMKVFVVSQAGKVADITLKSNCHTQDDSVLKVSSSCTSVYVDGSEIRGSTNASVLVKFGTYTGQAQFTVWMPVFPPEMVLTDAKLSQIKGWRIPLHPKQKQHKRSTVSLFDKRSASSGGGWQNPSLPEDNENGRYCKLRFQQSRLEVYARFRAEDQDSGRISYFLSRNTLLRITDLVQNLIRVADSSIASLKGQIVQGLGVGRTEVQVISPLTGRVIGAKEVRVANDKVTLDNMTVAVISGLQLSIRPDGDIESGYIAETSVSRRLTAKYQEGLLDVSLHFSDGSSTPLREIGIDDYFLSVDSLNPNVVAFAPMMAAPHPRVIAVGQGSGELLHISLELADDCHRRNSGALAMSLAQVDVDFTVGQKPEFVQNDGSVGRGNGKRKEHRKSKDASTSSGDLQDILIGIPMRDENNNQPTVQARQHPGGPHGPMSPLEIAMYILLGVFCLAIVVFVASCVVYASKFRDKEAIKSGDKSDSTTNAHDWVWLGRASLEHTSTTSSSQHQIRITSNPGYKVEMTTLDNPTHIQLPSRPLVNSTTYKKKRHLSERSQSTPPPTELAPPIPQLTTFNNLNESQDEKDYKPPIPPHRNIGVTAKISPSKVHPMQEICIRHNKPSLYGGIRVLPKPNKNLKRYVELRKEIVSDDLPDPGFVDFPDDLETFRKKESPEVKRANIIGNPMFSTVNGTGVTNPQSEVGLDLNLGMDYDQLLEYFDNLKESNA